MNWTAATVLTQAIACLLLPLIVIVVTVGIREMLRADI